MFVTASLAAAPTNRPFSGTQGPLPAPCDDAEISDGGPLRVLAYCVAARGKKRSHEEAGEAPENTAGLQEAAPAASDDPGFGTEQRMAATGELGCRS